MNVTAINEQTELNEEFESNDVVLVLNPADEYEIEIVDENENVLLAAKPKTGCIRFKIKKTNK